MSLKAWFVSLYVLIERKHHLTHLDSLCDVYVRHKIRYNHFTYASVEVSK